MITQTEAPRVLVCDSLPRDGLQLLYKEGYAVDLQFKLPQNELAGIIGD